MGTPAVEEKAKTHPLGGGYLHVDRNGNNRFDYGYDHIVFDENGNGQDDLLIDTVVIPEDLKLEIRNCPVGILKTLINGSPKQRAKVIESSDAHKKLYKKNIDAAKRAVGAGKYLIIGENNKYVKFTGKEEEREIAGFLAKAEKESQKACVSLARPTCEFYTTLYKNYEDMISHTSKEDKDSQGATDLEMKANEAIENAEAACNSILSKTDIYLHGAMICAAHGDKKCMNRYLTLACKKDHICKGEGKSSPEEIAESFTLKEDRNKARAALSVFNQAKLFIFNLWNAK